MKNEYGVELDLPELPSGYRWSVRSSNSPSTRAMFITLEVKKSFCWKEVRKALVPMSLDENDTAAVIKSGAVRIYNSYFPEYNPNKFIGVYQ